MVAVSAVDSHALEAVAMMAACLLARAVVTGFAHLTQKFQLDLERFGLFADTHQYAHRLVQHPAGIVRYFVLFAGASNIRVLSCMNLTFLLPRSA